MHTPTVHPSSAVRSPHRVPGCANRLLAIYLALSLVAPSGPASALTPADIVEAAPTARINNAANIDEAATDLESEGAGRLSIVSAVLLTGVAVAIPTTNRVDADAAGPLELDDGLTQPHVLTSEIADVIVRLRGGNNCTGTPITDTRFVVTAAHCVLDADGAVSGPRTIERDGIEYTALSVLVDTGYHDSPGPLLDAAVLIMDQAIPGPSATLGDVLPDSGLVTLAGIQPLDTDGSLLRGTRYDNRPLPQGTTGGIIRIDTAAAGCVHLASDLQTTPTQVTMPCGLIPGASGGGLFADTDGELTLVGITSTVTVDITANGLVPLASLHKLLSNPSLYTHDVPLSNHTAVDLVRS